MLTEEEWKEWLLHPATKRLREWAYEQLEDRKDRWADGDFTDFTQTAMIARNAGATGACSVYKEIVEMNYEKMGVKDEEPIGP